MKLLLRTCTAPTGKTAINKNNLPLPIPFPSVNEGILSSGVTYYIISVLGLVLPCPL